MKLPSAFLSKKFLQIPPRLSFQASAYYSLHLSFACSARRELLLLSPELLAVRMLELRKAVPFGDITELVRLSPWLLLLDVRPPLTEFTTQTL